MQLVFWQCRASILHQKRSGTKFRRGREPSSYYASSSKICIFGTQPGSHGSRGIPRYPAEARGILRDPRWFNLPALGCFSSPESRLQFVTRTPGETLPVTTRLLSIAQCVGKVGFAPNTISELRTKNLDLQCLFNKIELHEIILKSF